MCETVTLTEEEIRQEAEALAQRALKVPAQEAWRRVREGQYEGTILASRLYQLMFLLGEVDRSSECPCPAE